MKSMKRIIALLMAVLMLAALTACGNKIDVDQYEQPKAEEKPAASATESAPADGAAPGLRGHRFRPAPHPGRRSLRPGPVFQLYRVLRRLYQRFLVHPSERKKHSRPCRLYSRRDPVPCGHSSDSYENYR